MIDGTEEEEIDVDGDATAATMSAEFFFLFFVFVFSIIDSERFDPMRILLLDDDDVTQPDDDWRALTTFLGDSISPMTAAEEERVFLLLNVFVRADEDTESTDVAILL
mmetsp:Transcript_21835/g.24276  ORF Transcript_21835/g.24276 Transcript_21835/m.24276 type:complete len:108 (-) Transcript_21835:244-567(-)